MVITKTEILNWFAEFGYRYSSTLPVVTNTRTTANFLRLYTEVEYKLSLSTTAKLALEHLPNLTKTSESQSNAEISVNVAMTDIFSLKTGYLVNRNEATLPPGKKDTSTWTTALVAKY